MVYDDISFAITAAGGIGVVASDGVCEGWRGNGGNCGLAIAEYQRYLYRVELVFTRRVDKGNMTEETYYRLAKKLDEWSKQAKVLSEGE